MAKQQKNLWLVQKTVQKLEKFAKLKKMKVSAVVEQALEEYFDRFS